MVDLAPRALDALGPARPVALARAGLDDLLKVGLLAHPVGRRVRRQVRGHQAQVEGEGRAELAGAVHHAGPAREAPALLGVAAQVRERRGAHPALHLLEGAPGPDGREHVGAREGLGGGVVHVAGRHHVDAAAHRDLGQGVVARHVLGRAVVPQLDRQVLAAHRLDQARQLALGRARPLGQQRAGQGALATAREDQPLARAAGELLEGVARRALLPARDQRLGQGHREVAIPLGRTSQDDHVLARGVGHPRAVVVPGQGDLGAEDGGQAEGPRGLGEAHHAVEAVVVGEGQRAEPQARRLGRQLLGVAGPVEEAEVRVRVQLGVGGHQS